MVSLDGCPQGTNAYLQQPTNNPLICNGPADMICPVGFSCQLSPNLGRYQCCTGNSAGGIANYRWSRRNRFILGDGCPTGMVAYREPVTNAMRSCTLIGNQCPTPYGCLSTSSGQLQCCGVSGGKLYALIFFDINMISNFRMSVANGSRDQSEHRSAVALHWWRWMSNWIPMLAIHKWATNLLRNGNSTTNE